MILEVNNTFDERHVYFLKAQDKSGDSTAELKLESMEVAITKPQRFTKTWPKDFYVSVFNSRKGSYSISASDPFFPIMSGTGPINTTITLNSSKAHAKLVARVFSASPPIDPSTMSAWQKTRFLLAWWWVGLATFPRTIQQALFSMLNRGLKWVYRPEPRKDTMPRRADDMEVLIESIFKSYLRHIVEDSSESITLKYTPAGLIDVSEEIMRSPSAQMMQGTISELEISILTPLFYSRFVHYSNTIDGLLSEHYESATVLVSNPDLLSRLPFDDHAQPNPMSESNFRWDTICFTLLNLFRNRPTPITAHKKTDSKLASPSNYDPGLSAALEPIAHRMPGLESFLLSKPASAESNQYAGTLLKMFISEYVAFGWIEIWDAEIFLLRCFLAWGLARELVF